MSDVLPSTIKIKEQDVMKHNREHHQNSFSSIRKQSISSLTSHHSLSLEQKRKLNHKNNLASNANASKIHQKVADLESQISVMKQQHLDMLEALHNEIETLKTRNKGE